MSVDRATYRGMIVGKAIVYAHVFEEPLDMVPEEAFDLPVVEFGVNENSADVGLDDIRKALNKVSHYI